MADNSKKSESEVKPEIEESPAAEAQKSSPVKEAGGGWGGWGFSISYLSDLQKAAAEAAEEISRNAVEAARTAAKSISETVAEDSESSKEDDTEVSAVEEETDDEEDKRRKTALDKLEKVSEESFLSQGLKVIDTSVETFASGAWQALGTAWKGIENSATNLADSIQHGGQPGATGSVAPSLLETGKAFTAKGMLVLEQVGKETMDLLISETGILVDKKTDGNEDEDQLLEEISFDRCFYIYGGPEQLEELEALSNHYALLYNRRKAKLSSEEKSIYDGKLKEVQNIFDLGAEIDGNVAYSEKGKEKEAGNDGSMNELKKLHDFSVRKAAELAAGFASALAGLAPNDIIQRTSGGLDTIHSEGVHRLSEICCFEVTQLLMLGKSMTIISNANKLQDQEIKEETMKIDWPEDSVGRAKINRKKAQSMTENIEAIFNGFITGISDVAESYSAAIKSASAESQGLPQKLIQEKARLYCGTTALTILVHGRNLLVANAGDCRVVLNGELAITRALGDWYMKLPVGSASPLTAEPEFQLTTLTDSQFIFHKSVFNLEKNEMEGIYVVYVQTSSNQENQEGCQVASIVSPSWVQNVIFNYGSDPYFEKFRTSNVENPMTFPKHKLTGGLQRCKWILAVQNNQELSIGQSLGTHWYAIYYHTTLKMAPIQVLCDYQLPYMDTNLEEFNDVVKEKNIMMQLLWESSQRSQNQRKIYADESRSKTHFEVRDQSPPLLHTKTHTLNLSISLELYQSSMMKVVESIVGGENGATKMSPVVFTVASPWQVVGAPKANNFEMFYKEMFGAEKVSHTNHLKRKSEQRLPLIISAELKIESSIIVVFDLTVDSFYPTKSVVSGNVIYLETEDIVAAVTKGLASGAFWEDEKFGRKRLYHFDPCGQGSEKGGRIVVNKGFIMTKGYQEEAIGGVEGVTGVEKGGESSGCNGGAVVRERDNQDLIFRVARLPN